MLWRFLTLLSLIMCCMLAAVSVEKKLAGIKIGMKPKDVIALLGPPTATLIAQPPLSSGQQAFSMGGMPGAPAQSGSNLLVFIYKDGADKEREIELGTTGDAWLRAKAPWAYSIRVATLALDQQVLMYKINGMYSLGITISGQGAEAKVTDVVACSFGPLREVYNPKSKTFERKSPDENEIFKVTLPKVAKKFPYGLPARFSNGIGIGSTFAGVLKNYKWTEFLYPFSTSQAFLSTPNGTPPPAAPLPGKDTLLPNMFTPSVMVLGTQAAPPPGPVTTIAPPATFSDDAGTNISATFGKNCLMLYPDDKIAFTLIDFTVVRIQIGEGVSRPVQPALPTVGMPGR